MALGEYCLRLLSISSPLEQTCGKRSRNSQTNHREKRAATTHRDSDVYLVPTRCGFRDRPNSPISAKNRLLSGGLFVKANTSLIIRHSLGGELADQADLPDNYPSGASRRNRPSWPNKHFSKLSQLTACGSPRSSQCIAACRSGSANFRCTLFMRHELLKERVR